VSHDNSSITGFDDSCFSGNYITNDVSVEYLKELQNSRSDAAKRQRKTEELT
jgi:amidophosphoribosyltransferase